jgi:hypothetical protein
MHTPKKLATLGTQDTRQRQTMEKHNPKQYVLDTTMRKKQK